MRASGPGGHTFRPAHTSDASTIAAYHHRCWVRSFASLLEPGVVAAMDPQGKLSRWRRWLSEGSGFTTVVADVGGRAIGHTTVSGHELVHLFVDPAQWGRGLGRALLGIGEDLLLGAGYHEAELHTIVGNEPALALYRSAGWTVADRLVHNDEGGVTYDEHVLVKVLTAVDGHDGASHRPGA